MKKIRRLISAQQKEGGKVLYTYLIDDDDTEKPYKVASVDLEYEVGEIVATIWTKFSDTYNVAYLKKICQKCGKQYPKKDAVKHEYCEIPDQNASNYR